MAAKVQHPDLVVGFVGAGNMATAMARGFLSADLVSADHVIASARTDATLQKFQNDVNGRLAHYVPGVVVTKNNGEVASRSRLLFLSVKPQFLAAVLREIKDFISPDSVVVSVVAGISVKQISDLIVHPVKIMRVMPNTPCLISEGAAAFFSGPSVTEKDENLVKKFISKIGTCSKVEQEHLLDAVTGLSGSGPAYVLTMIHAMADGGVKMGLPRALALELAAQTVKGAAAMVLETGKHPAQLRDEIMSPAGTTAYGVHALEGSQGGFRNAVVNAVEAATTRAQALQSLGASD